MIATPHLGASTKEAEDNCAEMAAQSMMEYMENGNIVNSVNFPECDLGPISPDIDARIAILNKNIPSILGKITGILADLDINTKNLTNKSKGQFACTLIDIDGAEHVSREKLTELLDFDGIIKVRVLKG